MPTVCEYREMARAGCLLSCGPDFTEVARITERQVDQILKSAKRPSCQWNWLLNMY
jgi:hypothetical protein